MALAENPEPQRKLGFLDFPPITKIDGVNFGSHCLALEGGEGGGYKLPIFMSTKHLIETMSGNMKDKFAVVLNKIENLVVTFRHEKSTKTSSRFLCLNRKGNDKFYQTP